MTSAAGQLEFGDKRPYDATDAWLNEYPRPAPPPATDWAHRAARGVISDLMDRRSIKQGFNDIDEEIRIEIVQTLAKIIRAAKE